MTIDQNSLDKSLERLGRNDDFLEFLHYVYSQREASLGELTGTHDSRVQQIAGEVIFADRLLGVAGYREHQERYFRATA